MNLVRVLIFAAMLTCMSEPLRAEELTVPHLQSIIADSVLAPLQITTAKYPQDVKDKSMKASVLMRIVLRTDGRVKDAEAVYCDNPGMGFESAAETAAKNSEFDYKRSKNGVGYYRWTFAPEGELPAIEEQLLVMNDWQCHKSALIAQDSSLAEFFRTPADQFSPLEEMPVQISETRPDYPRLERDRGDQGTVWIRALVSKSGEVLCAILHRTSGHPGLDTAALEVALLNKFKPAKQNGQPVACWAAYKVVFKIID